MNAVPIDINALLSKGGDETISLLQYCVRSVSLEPLFVFLVREYQHRPTHLAALTLYDLFCAPNAPGRLSASALLPPLDLRLTSVMQILRTQWAQMQGPQPPNEETAVKISQPMRSMFDHLVKGLPLVTEGGYASVAQRYNPALRVNESLTDGKMNPSQRHFVNNVWIPHIRPRLIAAGFWRITTVD